MNTKQHSTMKKRGSSDVSYLGRTIDEMIWEFMERKAIPGLTLAIVQAPYIPRVVGYGFSDDKEKRLASVNTMWPVGPISEGYAAVAIIQLYEDGKLDLDDEISKFIPEVPKNWKGITVLNLLRHATGISDYREIAEWNPFSSWGFGKLLSFVESKELAFTPGTDVMLSATNFLLLTEIIERVSGKSYHDFVMERQIRFLNLQYTGFKEDLDNFHHEDVSKTENIHQLFKSNGMYINPTETAGSYDEEGNLISKVNSEALKGFSDIWASAQDVSIWDIALAGSVFIKDIENRNLIYKPWTLPNGKEVPAVAGWHFYKHRGLMDIKGSVPGYSVFLSRFTHPEELVCVTLLANKEGVDFTNLARCIAASFGDTLSTNCDDNELYLREGQFPVDVTVERLENELKKREIPLFAKLDHAKNAEGVDLKLRPTTVLVFGSPKVGTLLMQEDQSISLELPLKISIWEDEQGSTWLAFPRLINLSKKYNLEEHPVIPKMEQLMESLVQQASDVY